MGDSKDVIKAVKDFWTSNFQPELVSNRAIVADPLFAGYRAAQAQEKDALVKSSESHWNYWNSRVNTSRSLMPMSDIRSMSHQGNFDAVLKIVHDLARGVVQAR